MDKVIVILTCYNRKDTTVSCIAGIDHTNKDNAYSFVVVDDKSSDGTKDALKKFKEEGSDLSLIEGDGSLYYSGGMRLGMKYVKSCMKGDFYFLINDDVAFYPGITDEMIADLKSRMEEDGPQVLVGSTCSDRGELTYGGVKYEKRGIKYRAVGPKEDVICDTFNANCVLLPAEIFENTDIIDPVYIHSLGDYDYGLSISKKGIKIRVFDRYAGICNTNKKEGWRDESLSVKERLKAKESPKGAPFKQWFYFLRKNFGLGNALLHGMTPFLRILLGK